MTAAVTVDRKGEPLAEEAQPQGEAPEEQPGVDLVGDGSPPWNLQSLSDEERALLEPHLKGIEGNVTKRFQEFAEHRKRWEPYEELGIGDIQPDQIRELLQFAEMTQDEGEFAKWWEDVGKRLDLFPEEGGDDDLDFEDDDTLTAEKVKALIEESLNPVTETLTAEQEERAQKEALTTIQSEMGALEKEHGEFDREVVATLAERYAEDDPDNCIKRGFEDYQRIRGDGEKGLFDSKANQPKSPEGKGGAPATSPKPITTFEEAHAAAQRRLKESASA